MSTDYKTTVNSFVEAACDAYVGTNDVEAFCAKLKNILNNKVPKYRVVLRMATMMCSGDAKFTFEVSEPVSAPALMDDIMDLVGLFEEVVSWTHITLEYYDTDAKDWLEWLDENGDDVSKLGKVKEESLEF